MMRFTLEIKSCLPLGSASAEMVYDSFLLLHSLSPRAWYHVKGYLGIVNISFGHINDQSKAEDKWR